MNTRNSSSEDSASVPDKNDIVVYKTNTNTKSEPDKVLPELSSDVGEGGNYWRLRYEKLLDDYNQLHRVNQNLEEKLLNVVEGFEEKRREFVATVEHEKSTLMADVNKLSTKLVDARIKLHDFEEKEIIHASECSSPCHRNINTSSKSKLNSLKDPTAMQYDPNLV